MSLKRGTIALMGSGELTSTMVEVHKELLANLAVPTRAVFLDTPAGFQLNVDYLSKRAVEYFRTHVQQPMSIASFKSKESAPYEAEQAYHALRDSSFILIGPGSPTYAVRQWQQTPIPEIIIQRVEKGGCLVAASAAALTVGRFAIPVYEIYKVGEDLHWVEGINILGHFGFNLVVVPHWNNAEGGTHDTRLCYMGEPRFKELEALLPNDVSIFGLDEHTACLMDFEKEEALIRGIGRVILRRHGSEIIFEKGDRFPLEVLRGGAVGKGRKSEAPEPTVKHSTLVEEDESFWDRIHAIEEAFRVGLDKGESKESTNALLELDRAIWEAQQNLENDEFISQAREIFRELIVLFGMKLASSRIAEDRTSALVEKLVELREKCRQGGHWQEADAIRESLRFANIILEDTREGPRWRMNERKER